MLRALGLVIALLGAVIIAPSSGVAQQTCVTYGKQLCFTVPTGVVNTKLWREIDGNKQAYSFSLQGRTVQMEVVLLRLDGGESAKAYLDRVYSKKLESYTEGQSATRTDRFGVINAPAGQFTLWQADYVFHNGQTDPYRQKNVAYREVDDYAVLVYAWNWRGYVPLSEHMNAIIGSITVRNVQVSTLR